VAVGALSAVPIAWSWLAPALRVPT